MTDTKDQDATQLQRRARRRLVGAIALVVLAVIVLPIVFDKEPRPINQDLVIQIPSQDAPKFDPRLTPPPGLPPAADSKATEPKGPPGKAADAKATAAPARPAEAAPKESAKAVAKDLPPAKNGDAPNDAPRAVAKAAVKDVPKDVAKDVAKDTAPAKDAAAKSASDAKRAQALLEGKGSWIVPMGSYTSAERIRNLQARAKTAGFTSYTEQIKGPKGEDLIRLRAGPFAMREDADRARDALKSAGLVAGTVAQR